MGKPGENCDLHTYFPAMGEELRAALRSRPAYAIGLQSFSLNTTPGEEEIAAWLAKEGLEDLPWVNADVFHCASCDGRFEPFIRAVTRRPLIMVGPERLKPLYPMLRYAAYVTVPDRNCYLEADRIVTEVEGYLQGMQDLPVVSFSASMATNAMIHRLYPKWGDKAFLLDMGSVWDPYVGDITRQYHKDILDYCVKRAGVVREETPAGRRRGVMQGKQILKRMATPKRTVTRGKFYPGPKRRQP